MGCGASGQASVNPDAAHNDGETKKSPKANGTVVQGERLEDDNRNKGLNKKSLSNHESLPPIGPGEWEVSVFVRSFRIMYLFVLSYCLFYLNFVVQALYSLFDL